MRRPRSLVLASGSPQKRKLLIPIANELSLELVVNPADVEEIVDETPEKTAIANALLKLREVDDFFVVSSDAFAYSNGKMLFKPKSKKEASEMLETISGNEVFVYTATAVKIDGFELVDLTVSKLLMREFSPSYISKRVNNENILKKAGAFSISDVLAIDGDMNSVMGLNTSFVKKMYYAYIHELEHV